MSLPGYDAWLTTDRQAEEAQELWELWYESPAAVEAYAEADTKYAFSDWVDQPDGVDAFERWRDELP